MLYQVLTLATVLARLTLSAAEIPKSIDLLNGDPTFLPYEAMFNYSQYLVKDVHSPNAKNTLTEDLFTVLVVCSRETIIGCHSFEEFLSPNFVTFFVFDRWTADPFYNLSAFVQAQDDSTTMGAHLYVTDEYYGELLARKIAYDFVLQNNWQAKVKTLTSINCDMHPIPTAHKFYKNTTTIIRSLYDTLVLETSLRQVSKTLVENTVKRISWPVFAIGPVILETIPYMDSVCKGIVHGNDISGYETTRNCTRPTSLPSTSPWIFDALTWPEGHFLTFNFSLLMKFNSSYFSMTSFLAEERIIPDWMTRNGITLLRYQDVFVHFHLAPVASDLSKPYYAKIPMNDMLLRNYEMCAVGRTPWRINTTFFELRNRPVNVTLGKILGAGFNANRIKKHWIPTNVNMSSLDSELGARFWQAQMMSAGYYEDLSYSNTSVRRYRMFRVFPTNYRLTKNIGYQNIGSTMFNGEVTKWYTNDWKVYNFGGTIINGTIEWMNSMPETERYIDFPKSSKIYSFRSPYILNMNNPFKTDYTLLTSGGISPDLYFTQIYNSF